MSKKLPSVTSDIPRDLRTFVDRLREMLTGDGTDRVVTVDDLTSAGIASVTNKGVIKAVNTVANIGTPPAPTNVAAAAAIRNIIVSWDAPRYNGHAYAEIWGASTDNIGAAVKLGMSPGGLFVDAIGPSSTRYYWVRFVNILDVVGPYNAVLGTLGITGPEVDYLLEQLAGSVTATQLSSDLNSRIDLIDAPASVLGSVANQFAFMQGQIDAINAYPDFAVGTTYQVDDIVKYNGGIYKAKLTTVGNLPTDTVYWLKIGDYTSLADAVAAHTADIALLSTNLGAEASARETLAAQMRGTYTGTDITSITQGLLYSERTARANADSSLAGQISTVLATATGKNTIYRQTTAPTSPAVNDIWVDTRVAYAPEYFGGDFAVPKHKQYQWSGTTWIDITDQDISDNYGLIISEQQARASQDSALAQDITTLDTRVTTNDQNIRATLVNDYLTKIDTNAAIAQSASTLNTSINSTNSRVTTIETAKIGYSTRADGTVFDNGGAIVDKAAMDAWNATHPADLLTWNVGLPLAKVVKQVSVTAPDGSTATIENAFTALKDINGNLQAEYYLKLDLNGNVAGYGLLADATTSEFIVNADRFAVTSPESSIPLWNSKTIYAVGEVARIAGINDKTLVCKVGGTRSSITPTLGNIGTKINDGSVVWQVASRVPFAVQAVPQAINGVTLPAGVYVDAAYILNATIQTAQIADEAVDDSKIAAMSVAKLTAGTIDVDTYIQSTDYVGGGGGTGFRINGDGTAEFNEVTVRGTVYATDGQFTGEVISKGSGGNKARMFSGNVEIYKDVPAVGTVLYKALSRMETGVGQNNVQVTIPGYFTAQPKIIVSPANIKLYDAAYASQSQSIQCEALSIVESSAGSMVWSFTPKATLSLAANTGQTVINQSSGTQTGGWTSSQYTTASNTSAITANVTLASNRGTGTSGNYYYRTVRWKVQYLSGATWIDSAWSTTNLGADVSASSTTNITVTFPSAGTWVFRIVTEAYDTGGSFNVGTSYEYATDNLSRTDYQSITVNSPPQTTLTLNYSPSYSLPSGWEQTGQSITYTYSYQIINTPPYTSATITGSGLSLFSGSGTSLTKTYTSNLTLTFSATAGVGSFNSGSYAKLELLSLTGTVSRRRALTNSTTAVNNFSLNYYNYNLSSAQVLATGTLNWVAIGD